MKELSLTVRALIFDVDGTLCDSALLHYKAWSFVASQLGVLIPSWEDYVKECLRGQLRFEDLLDLRQTTTSDKSALYETKSLMFRQLALTSLRPFVGVTELWDHARAFGVRLALVSTARRPSVEDTVEILRLPHPDLIVTREDVSPHVKPDPAGYRIAAGKLRLNPSDCVAFEDSPAGIEAAVAAGIPCLAMVSPVFSSEEQSGAALVLNSLKDVELIPLDKGIVELVARGAS